MHPFIAKLSPGLFWDVDPATIDPKKHRKYIVQRVLERGSLSDWWGLRDFYTVDRVVEIAQQLRSLDPLAMAFIACIGKLKKEDFRCHIWRQLNPTLSPF